MDRSWYWRLALVVGLVLLAVYGAAPSFLYFTASPEARRSKAELKKLIPEYLPESRISFGIDLQGGLHLVMGVDAEKAVHNRTDRVGDEIFELMKEKGKPLESVERVGLTSELAIKLKADDDFSTLKDILDDQGDAWEVRSHSGTDVSFGMTETFEEQLRNDAVEQALKTLRNRIDKYGVTEPEVRRRGSNSILIQIAGLTADEEKEVLEDIIGRTAQLEFKMADDESKFFSEIPSDQLPEGVTLQMDSYRGEGDAIVSYPFLVSKDRKLLEDVIAKNPPPADRVVRYQRLVNKTGDETWRTYLLHRKTPLTGDSLVRAGVIFDPDENRYAVSMQLDRRGAEIFDRLTGENVKKRFAIVLDEIVDSAPVIQTRIPNGNARITLGGAKSNQEILSDAKALAIVLNAGALPAPVYPQENRTVGATLGDDAVEKGKVSIVAAAIVMMLIMLVYYRLSGVIALIALSVNMLLLFASLAAFGATLTLPGIAGLALTIGMAVDANIIQFERIREELRAKKTPRAAVDSGFDKAFSAIFDANVTTLIACIVLYQYGSGPIRGFATTLGVGVIINTFTAVVVPRLCLDFFTRGRRVQELSI